MGDAEEKIVRIKAYMKECIAFQYGNESDYAKKVAKDNTFEFIKKNLFTDQELTEIKEEAVNKR